MLAMPSSPAHSQLIETRRATEADVDAMTNVEASARQLLEAEGVDFAVLHVSTDVDDPTGWSLAFVAEIEGKVIPMARLTELTPDVVCLDQISTTAGCAGRGVGRRLLADVATACRDLGFSALTGTTFRDVAFNAPFYTRLGCVEDNDPHPAMLRRRRVEQELGLDQFGPRLIMRLSL